MATSDEVAVFGWRGIEVTVPSSWELCRHSGNREAGYASLDDGGQVRLHVRWDRAKTLRRSDLRSSLERYERSLRKKSGTSFLFKTEGCDFLPAGSRNAEETVPFYWEDEHSVFGLASRCHKCNRVLFVEVMFPQSEVDQQAALEILGSVKDHREDGQCLWSVYGFAFLAPDSYNLEKAGFVPGRIRFLLRESRRSWLRAERWGVASQWLKKAPLERWPEELLKMMQLPAAGSIQRTPAEVNGRDACRFVHRPGRPGLSGPGDIEGLVWPCCELDQVLVVVACGGEDGLCDKVAATMKSA